MTPTMELRFVEREIDNTEGTWKKTVRVLQQKWLNLEGRLPAMEWVDVPLVKEEA